MADTKIPWAAFDQPKREFLANLAVLLMHYCTPEELPEEIAQLGLLAEDAVFGIFPPLPEWTD